MKNLIFLLIIMQFHIYSQTLFNLPPGELIEGFENLNDWNLGGTGVYDSLEVSHHTEGSYSIKLGTSKSERATMIKTISLNFYNYETFSIDVYTPDFSKEIFKSIRIELTSSEFITKVLRANIYAGERLYIGWNRLVFSKNDFISSGSENWSNTMVNLRFTATTSNNNIISPGFITFDNFRAYHSKAPPIAIITFDDNWRSNLDIGKPILDSLGLKGVEYVIGKTASQVQPDRLHWSDYDSLYQEGWDICNHTYNHDTLTHLTVQQLETTINGMRDTLISHGYSRSADFFAYPYGYFNKEVISKVKEKHKLARCTTDWQYLAHPSLEVGDYFLLRKHSELDSYEQTTMDIDKTIERGQLLVFLFHDISSIAEKFSSIMHYLKAKQDSGLIQIMTMSEYWEYLNTASEVEEVGQRSDMSFVLEQNYPNPFNPSTNITYQIHKSGWVNIKVYDTIGRELMTLVSEEKPVGKYTINFDNNGLSSGVYFYSITVGGFSQTRKMILIK